MIERFPIVRQAIVDDYVETVRQEGRGQISDWAVIFHPWGFDLADIHVPVSFWQGEEDGGVPVAAARAQAAAIPGSHLTIYPGEGHHAFFTHWRDILRELTASASSPSTADL